jgi:hypothetical protein
MQLVAIIPTIIWTGIFVVNPEAVVPVVVVPPVQITANHSHVLAMSSVHIAVPLGRDRRPSTPAIQSRLYR